ncbi:putative E3 ubiquitin-protein ligase ARI4 [Podospora fimiseda]|uniref:E3 ubiquitin-protein ligase ARI4 n=1 Tax=Podospora fimiseda TaxID=252190 RepID=A0AAN7BMU8_9PEZI|nr:putative E3 ubiquitin-protein ligase ARI4 [Podospora fimiseda]
MHKSTMVFSGLISSSSSSVDRAAKTAAKASSTPHFSHDTATSGSERHDRYISEESQIRALEPEPPDLQDLNACLDALAAVFPDIQIEVFRELLTHFDGESRRALAADALLKNRVTWVKGRWKVNKDGEPPTGVMPTSTDAGKIEGFPPVPRRDAFRSDQYKKAVKALAYHEFKGLSRSTINAVLAETNYIYLEAREALVALSAKSWRFTFSSLFRGHKVVSAAEAKHHPLVIYKSAGSGAIEPTIKSTGCSELDNELYHALIAPIKKKQRSDLETRDHEIAVELNNAEAEETGNMFECACCYTETIFEEMTSCNAAAHLVCFRCVQHTISEAVFGQGWHRSIEKNTGTLCCPAVDSSECSGRIPQDHMLRAMLNTPKGAEVMHRLDQRLADNSLVATELPLVRCPFCSYAEVDEIYIPVSHESVRLRLENIIPIIFILLCILTLPFAIPTFLTLFLIFLCFLTNETTGPHIRNAYQQAVQRRHRRRRGMRFTCQNPKCSKQSCLSCQKAWKDPHVCNESALISLRTQIEQAMSMAIKRVCPKCNTSFVKNEGCNKLTCVCGYKMCYVCRKDISATDGPDAGYRHFCDHFRPGGDARSKCANCTRCNLWEAEDTDKVLEEARREAERKWMASEGRELNGAERKYLTTGIRGELGGRSGEIMVVVPTGNRLPTLDEICDFYVEYFTFY